MLMPRCRHSNPGTTRFASVGCRRGESNPCVSFVDTLLPPSSGFFMVNARIVDRAPERTLFANPAPFVRLPVASVKAGAIVDVELDLFNFERWGLIMGELGATTSGEFALST